jgi:hypothetical protein
MAIKIPNDAEIHQNFPTQDPPKYTHIGIFGMENIPSGNPAWHRPFDSGLLSEFECNSFSNHIVGK